jgi:SH3-like domain-containing protein
MQWPRCSSLLLAALSWVPVAYSAQAQPAPAGFASLLTDHVDARREPGVDKPITVVFNRAGMPVKVIEQTKDWARIQDVEGVGGWVPADLISRRRTGVVLTPPPASAEKTVPMRATERTGSAVLAILEPGVIVGVVSCDGQACRITTAGVRGFVDQSQLWGVAAGELVK